MNPADNGRQAKGRAMARKLMTITLFAVCGLLWGMVAAQGQGRPGADALRAQPRVQAQPAVPVQARPAVEASELSAIQVIEGPVTSVGATPDGKTPLLAVRNFPAAYVVNAATEVRGLALADRTPQGVYRALLHQRVRVTFQRSGDGTLQATRIEVLPPQPEFQAAGPEEWAGRPDWGGTVPTSSTRHSSCRRRSRSGAGSVRRYSRAGRPCRRPRSCGRGAVRRAARGVARAG